MTFPNTKATGLPQLPTERNGKSWRRAISSSGLTWPNKVTRAMWFIMSCVQNVFCTKSYDVKMVNEMF